MNQQTLDWLCKRIKKPPTDLLRVLPYTRLFDAGDYVFSGNLPCRRGVARVVRDGRVKYKKVLKPSAALKKIQQLIRDEILWSFVHRAKLTFDFAHGGFSGCSIKTHAQPHLGSRFFFVTDLSHAYASVNLDLLRDCLANLDFYPDVVQTLIEINTHRDQLPIGFAASPLLFNLALHSFDIKIVQLLTNVYDRPDVVYTRYYDDLVFSSPNELGPLKETVSDVLEEFGFSLKDRKTFYGDVQQNRICFTGLTITPQGITLSKKKRKNFEGLLLLAQHDPLKWKPKVAGKLGLFHMVYEHHLPRKIDYLLQNFDAAYATAWRHYHGLPPI